MEAISIAISENRTISLYEVYQNHLWFSPHPSDSIEARWGLKKCKMIQDKVRSTHQSIAFIEKTYRKKDPRYADFSIRQQRHLLARLNEEWRKSECREPPPPLKKVGSRVPPQKETIPFQFDRKRCEKIEREIRATHKSMAVIEKTYGMKDPEYADFSIRQQQHLLKRFHEEWSLGGCGDNPPEAFLR
jgi:ribosomal protein L32E